jgi:membrane protease YdiL (CAAX protease family)
MKTRFPLWLWTEFLLLFGGTPLLILAIRERSFMIMLMWGSAIIIALVLHKYYRRSYALEWNWPGLRTGWKDMAKIFLPAAALLTAIAYVLLPEQFLSLPRDRPQLWWKIMLLYPILSVWPQELIYRSFLYHRYAPIFGTKNGYVAASTLAFAWLHIMFLNPVAIILTFAGGWFFSKSYSKHHSLALVCAEHAAYGCLLFTVGYGWFFFSGAAWR